MERSPVNSNMTTMDSKSGLGRTTDSPSSSPVSEETMDLFRFILWAIAWGIVSIFGTVTNSINIAVFVKTGFKDTITISLFMLAVSDFGSCFTLIWVPPLATPWFRQLDLHFRPDDVIFLYAMWPHILFTKLTTLTTAFICFERCLCVYLPLKVKSIITRKRVIVYMVFIYIFIFFTLFPFYYLQRLNPIYYPNLNKTLLSLEYMPYRDAIILGIVLPVLDTGISMTSFVFILVATILLIWKLKQQSKWRQKSTKPTEVNNDVSSKERKISKTVATISSLFVISFIPTACFHIGIMIEKRLDMTQEYVYVSFIIFGFTVLTECINSGVNIFIYYHNSTNYRAVFDQMFRRKS